MVFFYFLERNPVLPSVTVKLPLPVQSTVVEARAHRAVASARTRDGSPRPVAVRAVVRAWAVGSGSRCRSFIGYSLSLGADGDRDGIRSRYGPRESGMESGGVDTRINVIFHTFYNFFLVTHCVIFAHTHT